MNDGWTCLADVVGLQGHGLLFGDLDRAHALAARCADAGYTVVAIDTAGVTEFREAQQRIAAALRLPASAGRNLDALADSLRDLARHWPDARRIALLWTSPEQLIEADDQGWFRLADVLQEASERLWRGDADPADRVFETVLLVHGFDR